MEFQIESAICQMSWCFQQPKLIEGLDVITGFTCRMLSVFCNQTSSNAMTAERHGKVKHFTAYEAQSHAPSKRLCQHLDLAHLSMVFGGTCFGSYFGTKFQTTQNQQSCRKANDKKPVIAFRRTA